MQYDDHYGRLQRQPVYQQSQHPHLRKAYPNYLSRDFVNEYPNYPSRDYANEYQQKLLRRVYRVTECPEGFAFKNGDCEGNIQLVCLRSVIN